jgi:acyl-CoA synthetase (AMP-forming)/AMP-acid ligase II
MSYEEGGEMLVSVPNEKAFQGYWRAEEATKKKFVRDLFKKGDMYFRTGDVLRRDADGRWHFVDRLGDTFRWKSENVSTAEVAIVLGQYPGVAEANVYGVLLPNHDGRAGCAALQLASDCKVPFDYNDLLRYAKARLPRYAVPVFIRKVDASAHMHNHKQNKVALREEGVNPSLIGTKAKNGKNDKFLWVPPRGDRYIDFTESDWRALEAGQARL